MTVEELQERVEIAEASADEWAKITLIIMQKYAYKDIIITDEDLEYLENSDEAISLKEEEDGIHINAISIDRVNEIIASRARSMH